MSKREFFTFVLPITLGIASYFVLVGEEGKVAGEIDDGTMSAKLKCPSKLTFSLIL